MATEKKRWGFGKIFLFLMFWVVVAIVGGGWALVRYIHSTDFAVDLKIRANIMTGSYIDFDKVNWDLLRQLSISKFKMMGEKQETPQSAKLTANQLELDYNWKALLHRKLEFTEFNIDSPSVLIVQNQDGSLNLPFAVKGSPPPPNMAADKNANANAPASTTKPQPPSASDQVQVVWPKFDLKNGDLTVRRFDGANRLQVMGVNINGRCPMATENAPFAAEGQAQLKQTRLLDLVNITNIKSLFNFAGGVLKLTSLEADAYGGKISGETETHVSDQQKAFNVKLDGMGLNVNQLMNDIAGKKDMISGNLEAKTTWLGELGAVEKMTGQGAVEIKQGQVINMPIFRKLAAILGNVSAIAQPDFSVCKMDYTMANQTVDVSSLQMKSSMFDLTAHGKVFFNQNVEMEGQMALNPEAMKLIPKEVSSAFKQREDGYTLVDLKITGMLEDPKVEVPLTNVIMNKAVDMLQGLLGKKKEEAAPATTPPADGQTPAPQQQPQEEKKPLFDLNKLLKK